MKQREYELIQLKLKVVESLRNGPGGKIKYQRNHNTIQYYYSPDRSGSSKSYKYLRRSCNDIAEKIFQRDYDELMLAEINEQLDSVNKCIDKCCQDKLESVYDSLDPARKQGVKPWILSQEEYFKKWIDTEYKGYTLNEESKCVDTERGDHVRSKSEKIIADKLLLMDIPYHYEKPLILSDRTIYPDFTVLNKRTKQEYYYEHFGMMDNPEYARNAIAKINFYIRHNILPGIKLLFSFETSDKPISSFVIEKIIKEYLI